MHRWEVVLSALPACLIACYVPGLTPDSRTPADRARGFADCCSGFTEAGVAPLLAPSAFDSVDPAYSYVKSGSNDREPRLRGARIQVKPLPGFSREAMARTLECHQARVTLGQAPSPEEDPFVLPGTWLDIDVDSVGDGFTVRIQTDDVAVARRILDRARTFAAKKTPVF